MWLHRRQKGQHAVSRQVLWCRGICNCTSGRARSFSDTHAAHIWVLGTGLLGRPLHLGRRHTSWPVCVVSGNFCGFWGRGHHRQWREGVASLIIRHTAFCAAHAVVQHCLQDKGMPRLFILLLTGGSWVSVVIDVRPCRHTFGILPGLLLRQPNCCTGTPCALCP